MEKRDIVEVLEEYLDSPLILKGTKSKPYYETRCPFHEDTNPSFQVYPLVQRCHCWSCWTRDGFYDVIDFYRKLTGADFDTAKKAVTEEITPAMEARKNVLKILRQRNTVALNTPSAVLLSKRIRKITKGDMASGLLTVADVFTEIENGATVQDLLRRI